MAWRQLISDAAELAAGERSRDLASGTRTWPIAWLLSRLEGAPRQQLLALLQRAQSGMHARLEVRRLLFDAGALARVGLEANTHRQSALRAIDHAHLGPLRERWLRAIVAATGWEHDRP